MSARAMQRQRGRRARRALRRASVGAAAAMALSPAAASADSIVTNSGNSGPGSLRQAVIDSNADPDADTITFASSVTGTITLGSELPITYSTTISGPGAGSLTVRAPSSRAIFFYAFAPATLRLSGITITGNLPGAGDPGAGIDGNCAGFEGQIVLEDAAVSNSSANGPGGGIFTDGCDVSLNRASITGNAAKGTGNDGGGIFVSDAAGGGVVNAVTAVDSRVTGNSAPDNGAGIAIDGAPAAAVTVVRSTISGNSTGPGACQCGGGVYLDGSGPVTINSSTLSGNHAGAGGGLLLSSGGNPTFAMRNSTVAGNSGQGGGLYLDNGSGVPFTVANSTIASNSAPGSEGGGIYFFGGAGDNLLLRSTIVANNTDSNGDPDIHRAQSGSGTVFVDHSLIGSTAGAGTITETAPGTGVLGAGPVQLGPLADNGGPTQTMLPATGGPAIDAGAANGLATDQRGLARTVQQPGGPAGGDGTDIGAVELADAEVSGAGLKAKRKQKLKGRKVVVKVSAGAAEDVTVTATGSAKAGKAKVPLRSDATEVAAGTTEVLSVKPASKGKARKLARYLGSGRKAKVSLQVTFTDGAGNQTAVPAKVRLARRK